MKKYKILTILIGIFIYLLSMNASYGYGCSEYWIFAKSNFNWTCSCMSWYQWGTDVFGEKSCVNASKICRQKFWVMSQYDRYDKSCTCYSGYVFSEKSYWGWYECKSCTSKYGINAKYNGITESCECKDGYTLKEWKCEEKNNSAYFYLVEYDDTENEAIIVSYYTEKWYKIELRYTSWLYKADSFVWKDIVINMWTDFFIDRWDYFVLNNKTKTTDVSTEIRYVEEVDDWFTLKSCEDIYWYNSEETYDNKCTCKSWYKWNTSKTQCNFVDVGYDSYDYSEPNQAYFTEEEIEAYSSLFKRLDKIENDSPWTLNNLVPILEKLKKQDKYKSYIDLLDVIIKYIEYNY